MPPVVQLIENFPGIYGTQKFITVFARIFHQPLPRAPFQAMPSRQTFSVAFSLHANYTD
jgi:hypothetical protein